MPTPFFQWKAIASRSKGRDTVPGALSRCVRRGRRSGHVCKGCPATWENLVALAAGPEPPSGAASKARRGGEASECRHSSAEAGEPTRGTLRSEGRAPGHGIVGGKDGRDVEPTNGLNETSTNSGTGEGSTRHGVHDAGPSHRLRMVARGLSTYGHRNPDWEAPSWELGMVRSAWEQRQAARRCPLRVPLRARAARHARQCMPYSWSSSGAVASP